MRQWERLAYDVGQGARVAWFLGHSLIAERIAPPVTEPIEIQGKLPTRVQMLAELVALLQRDRANIAAGHYRVPHDLIGKPSAAWRQSRRFFADLGAIDRRRRAKRHDDWSGAPRGERRRYPEYFLQNFHYQTDGYLSDRSAELYDFQVEVLFNGAADAMRRQALVAIADRLRDRPLARQPLLDVACGTGRLLSFVKQNWPRLPVTGLDLSGPYLRKASHDLAGWSWVELVEGTAERLPFRDGSFALVSCTYLFHELPREVRAAVAAEMARVLRPGGRLVFVDSFQHGDHPEFEGLLELFPRAYHEPFYADYVRQDLAALFAGTGLSAVSTERVYMSKVMVLDKPA
jgi:ubiquinone/menaquinone biosynthesis C-methylase UbiE